MSSDNVCAVISKLEDRRYQAMLTGNVEDLESLLSPSLRYAHSNLTTDGKSEYIRKVQARIYDYRSIQRHDEVTTVVGDTAIVTGRLSAVVSVNGSHRNLNNLYLVVWAKADGTWKCLAYQPTVIPA